MSPRTSRTTHEGRQKSLKYHRWMHNGSLQHDLGQLPGKAKDRVSEAAKHEVANGDRTKNSLSADANCSSIGFTPDPVQYDTWPSFTSTSLHSSLFGDRVGSACAGASWCPSSSSHTYLLLLQTGSCSKRSQLRDAPCRNCSGRWGCTVQNQSDVDSDGAVNNLEYGGLGFREFLRGVASRERELRVRQVILLHAADLLKQIRRVLQIPDVVIIWIIS